MAAVPEPHSCQPRAVRADRQPVPPAPRFPPPRPPALMSASSTRRCQAATDTWPSAGSSGRPGSREDSATPVASRDVDPGRLFPEGSAPSLPRTAVGPRSLPRTAVGPRSLPRTAVGPRSLPRTAVGPRSLPWTAVGPRSLPRTAVGPRSLPRTAVGPRSLLLPSPAVGGRLPTAVDSGLPGPPAAPSPFQRPPATTSEASPAAFCAALSPSLRTTAS